MLVELFPRVHRRYTSLAIIGPVLDGYGRWLLRQGYSAERAREHFRAAPRLVRRLQQRDVRALTSLTRVRLRACAPADSQESLLRKACSAEFLPEAAGRARVSGRDAAFAG